MTSQGCRQVSKYILLGLTVLAWIFSVSSVASCSFVRFGGVSFGLFKGGGYDGASCVRYSSANDYGSALKTARAFGVLLTLGMSAAMVLVMVVVLLHPHPAMWITYRVLLGLCFVFNLLTFAAFGECADFDSLTFLTCSLGGASVCAILNSFLLLPLSVLSCCIPTPEEPVFKNGFSRAGMANTGSNNTEMVAGSQTVKRTVEEMPDGKKITEEVTDASGITTVTTTFEPKESVNLEMDGFNVGPTVRTMVSDLPNGKKMVEEDAQGNQTITTKVVVMASDNWTRSTAQYKNDSEIIVANATPQYQDSSSDAVMAAAAVIAPMGGSNNNGGRSYGDGDEERGMANPYIDHDIQEHVNRQVNSQYEQSSPRASRSSRSSRPKSSKHGRSRGQADDAYDEGTTKPVPSDMSGYVEDSVSSAFTDSNTYGMNSTSSSLDNSFMDSSGNFDNSFAPNDSTALDGAERRSKKKKKKKHHKSHRSGDGEHRESRSKKQKEGSDNIGEEEQQQQVGASEIGPYE